MDKKVNYNINEVSKLLNIPKATIRYWESQGLLRPKRNQENDYREFSLSTTVELSNISFFRYMDIPVKEIKHMINSDISVQEKLLENAEIHLQEKQLELKRQAQRIQMQKQLLQEIHALKERGLQRGEPVFQRAVAFSHGKESHWQRTIELPWTFVLVFSPEGEYEYGIGYEADEEIEAEDTIIWEKGEGTYMEGLLITDNKEEGKNNLSSQKQELLGEGIFTKGVLAQYYTSGIKEKEGALDYYKMWVEIET